MPENPITVPLPQDLPENWKTSQTVSVDGTSVGLTPQHGYNYLMEQVNNAQTAAQQVGNAIPLCADLSLSNLNTPQMALYHLGAGVRPNLLDNPYFVGGGSQQGGGQLPINQMGLISYNIGQRKTTIDRWESTVTSITASLSQSGLTLDSSGTSGEFYQRISSNFSMFAKKVLTLSALTVDGQLYTASGQVPAESPDVLTVFLQTALPFGFLRFAWGVANLSYFVSFVWNEIGSIELAAVKLEIGDTQTLAYQDTDGNWQILPQPDMDYIMQLAKCQNYLINLDNGSTVSTRDYPGTWVQTASNAGQYFIPLPTTMRTTPGTVTPEGQFYIWGYGNSGSASIPVTLAYAPSASTPNTVVVQVSVTGDTLPDLSISYGLSRRDSSSRILVSAEL